MGVKGGVKVRFSQFPAAASGCSSVWQTVHRPHIGSYVSDKLTDLFIRSLIFVALRFVEEKSAVLLWILFELRM
jgi:hypothetical protein